MFNVNGCREHVAKLAERDRSHRFSRLYRSMCNEAWLTAAWDEIRQNQGSNTPGIDGKTRKDVDTDMICKLSLQLKSETFRPQPVRRHYIPKRGGKLRPLGIPTIECRIVQSALKMLLEPLFEPKFRNCSHGFRNQRSTITALKDVINRFPRSTWIIEGDIKGCFDNIQHGILLEFIQKRIADQRIVRLISLFLKAGYVERREYHRTYSGTPQGGIISPLLSNVYLMALDDYMENQIGANRYESKAEQGQRKNPEYKKFEYLLMMLRKQYSEIKSEGIGLTDKRNKLRDAELRNIRQEIRSVKRKRELIPALLTQKRIGYVRYADDYLITLQEFSKQGAETLKADIARYLFHKLRLEQDKDKTLISHPTDSIRFLGYNLTSTGGRSKRPRLDIPKEAVRKVIEDVEKQCKLHFMPEADLIIKVNSIVIGWMNYYRYANGAGKIFNRIMTKVFDLVARFLADKFKTRRKQIFIKFKAREESKDGRSRNTIGVKVGDRVIKLKTIPPQTSTIYAVNQNRKPIGDDLRPNIVHGWAAGRSTQRAIETLGKANRKCEYCGTTHNLNVHHIGGLRGKRTVQSKTEARSARQTIVLCRDCHLLQAHDGSWSRNANNVRGNPA